MIPAAPSGSYLAEGLVIISMFSIVADGICFSSSLGSSWVGLPSMSTLKFELPRRVTLSWMSTLTEGTLRSASTAVPEVALGRLLTLTTCLSIS